MSAARRKRGSGLLLPAIVTVIIINGYAYSQLVKIARSWKVSLLPGSVSSQLSQLALILAINSIIIAYLLLSRK